MSFTTTLQEDQNVFLFISHQTFQYKNSLPSDKNDDYLDDDYESCILVCNRYHCHSLRYARCAFFLVARFMTAFEYSGSYTMYTSAAAAFSGLMVVDIFDDDRNRNEGDLRLQRRDRRIGPRTLPVIKIFLCDGPFLRSLSCREFSREKREWGL